MSENFVKTESQAQGYHNIKKEKPPRDSPMFSFWRIMNQ